MKTIEEKPKFLGMSKSAIKRRIERSNELAISLAEYEYYLLANRAQHEELRNMIVPGHEDFLERKIFFEDLLNRINS